MPVKTVIVVNRAKEWQQAASVEGSGTCSGFCSCAMFRAMEQQTEAVAQEVAADEQSEDFDPCYNLIFAG